MPGVEDGVATHATFLFVTYPVRTHPKAVTRQVSAGTSGTRTCSAVTRACASVGVTSPSPHSDFRPPPPPRPSSASATSAGDARAHCLLPGRRGRTAPARGVEERTFRTERGSLRHFDPSRAASLTPPSTPRGLRPREPDGGHSPPLTATQRHARGDHAAREQKTPADAPRRLARPHPRAPQRVSPTHRAPATLRPLHASPPLKLARHLLLRSPFSFSSQGTPREAFVTPALRGQAASQQTSLKSKEGPWTSLAQSHFFAWSPKGRRVRANEAAAWGQTFLVREAKPSGAKARAGPSPPSLPAPALPAAVRTRTG